MRNPTVNALEALKTKRAALDARIQRLEQRDKEKSRKSRSHALVLLGAAIEQQIVQEPSSVHLVRQMIVRYLKKPRDQEVVLSYLFPAQSSSGDSDGNQESEAALQSA
jgi:hypothetical protein